jgi:hypothetical protein
VIQNQELQIGSIFEETVADPIYKEFLTPSLYGFCRICSGSSVKQAVRQKTTDTLESPRRPSALEGRDASFE